MHRHLDRGKNVLAFWWRWLSSFCPGLLSNDIGRPRAWRWAKIRRMENLPFHQNNRTRTLSQSRGQQTLQGGGNEMERIGRKVRQSLRLRHGLLKQVPPCGRPLREIGDTGRGRVVQSPRYASLPMISFESRRRLTLESFANRNARTDQRSPAARGAATVAGGFAVLSCSATFDLRATPSKRFAARFGPSGFFAG